MTRKQADVWEALRYKHHFKSVAQVARQANASASYVGELLNNWAADGLIKRADMWYGTRYRAWHPSLDPMEYERAKQWYREQLLLQFAA